MEDEKLEAITAAILQYERTGTPEDLRAILFPVHTHAELLEPDTICFTSVAVQIIIDLVISLNRARLLVKEQGNAVRTYIIDNAGTFYPVIHINGRQFLFESARNRTQEEKTIRRISAALKSVGLLVIEQNDEQ